MTYQELINQILQLQDEGLEIFNAGKSTLGKNILATHVGNYSGPQIIIQAGIHAREWITTLLLVEQARYLHNTEQITQGGIYFVFLTNPDGIEIALDGIDVVDCEITKNYLISANNQSQNFSTYKANINLVDLNTNFDAKWGQGIQNVFCPSTENFVGFFPNSEREVQNLINLTLKNKPLLTISYHSKGNVIFYGFETQSENEVNRDRKIGERLSELTGYPLIFTENSTGGYKDWCIDKLKIPAYTIEVGDESLPHPISEENLPEIYLRNKDVPLAALNLAIEYQKEIDFTSPIVQNIKKEKEYESNEKAFQQGYNAFLKEEIPVGAVIVKDNKIIAQAHNKRENSQIATHHAEILAIEKACKKLKSWRLDDCEIYVTLEPCPMCAGAISNARIKTVFYAVADVENGGYSRFKINENTLNHTTECFHLSEFEKENKDLIQTFFKQKRNNKKKRF